MKKRMIVSALACLVLFGAAGCGKKETKPAEKVLRIGVSIPAADHGWTGGVVWNAQESQKKWEADGSVKVIVSTARDAAEQVDHIENLLAQDIDALVVLPQEPEPLTAICAQAKKQHKLVISVDRGLADTTIQDVFVAGDNPGFGALSAEIIAKTLDYKGNILVMEGIPCVVNTDRVEAFRKALEKYPDIKIMESQSAGWDTGKGLTLMENYLQKYPQIDGVWTGDDDVLLGALKAVAESGRKDIKTMVGGGGSKHVIKMIAEGHPQVHATVTYPPKMISNGIDLAVKILRGELVADKKVVVPAYIITKNNASDNYYPSSIY